MGLARDSLTSTSSAEIATGRRLLPVHPGAVLLHDFIEEMGLTRYRVAKALNVPQRRVNEICAETRGISADTALRLARLFGMDAQTWLNLQAQYDLEVAELKLRKQIDSEVTPLEPA